MKMYVIYKNSRTPTNRSYSGITWDEAGIASFYKEQYASKTIAECLASRLSQSNPVGFSVAEVEDVSQV